MHTHHTRTRRGREAVVGVEGEVEKWGKAFPDKVGD